MLTLISDIFTVEMTIEIKGKASQRDLSMTAFVPGPTTPDQKTKRTTLRKSSFYRRAAEKNRHF